MGVMEARRRILLNQPHLIDASGNPISFSTDMAAKMGVKAYFSPEQSGSGDPSPSNVRPITGWTGCEVTRCGKNLLDPNERNDSYVANIQYNYTNPLKLPAGTYTASCSVECSGIYILEGNSNIFSKYNSTFITFTMTEPKAIKINFYKEGIDHSADCQLEVGSTASPYTPYSGAAYPVTFPAVGKNLCNGVAYECGISNDIPRINSTTPITSPFTTRYNYSGAGFFAQVKAGVTYAFSSDETGSNSAFYIGLYGSIEDALDRANIIQYTSGTTFTPNSDGYLLFMRYTSAKESEVSWTYAQCEAGSTATSYEPFTNTLYGGYVDYEKGEVVATMAYEQMTYSYINGLTEDVYIGYESAHGVWIRNWNYEKAAPRKAGGIEAYCNLYDISMHNTDIFGSQYRTYFENADSVASFKTAVQTAENNGDGLYIAYELATPIHYPITPAIIKTLRGANTIWSDLNGNVDLKYWKH